MGTLRGNHIGLPTKGDGDQKTPHWYKMTPMILRESHPSQTDPRAPFHTTAIWISNQLQKSNNHSKKDFHKPELIFRSCQRVKKINFSGPYTKILAEQLGYFGTQQKFINPHCLHFHKPGMDGIFEFSRSYRSFQQFFEYYPATLAKREQKTSVLFTQLTLI